MEESNAKDVVLDAAKMPEEVKEMEVELPKKEPKEEKKEEKPKEKVELSPELKARMDVLDSRRKALSRDKKQEPVELKAYLENRLKAFKRWDKRDEDRIRYENQKQSRDTIEMMVAAGRKRLPEIKRLEALLEALQ